MKNKIPIPSQTKAFIFDIDGTLADTMPLHYEAWEEVGKKHRFTMPKSFFYDMAGLPSRSIILNLNEKYGYRLDPDFITLEKENAVIEKLNKSKPIRPIVDLVYEYHNKLPMSLGTGGKRKFAKIVIEAIGLTSYFEILVSSEDVEKYKPFPDTFLKCAQLMGIAPENCLVFEDGEFGIEAARRAGMMCVDIRKYI